MFKKEIIFLVLFFGLCLFGRNGEAEENYLQFRHETGKNEKNSNSFSSSRLLMENYSKNWIGGFKLIMKEDGYMFFNPYLLYKISENINIGSRYTHDSLRYKALGPIVRYSEKFGNFSTTVEYAYDFALDENRDFFDLSGGIFYKKDNWKIGSEVGYYFYKNKAQNLKIRPIKISYNFMNYSPFLMLQRRWNDEGLIINSIFGGIGIKF